MLLYDSLLVEENSILLVSQAIIILKNNSVYNVKKSGKGDARDILHQWWINYVKEQKSKNVMKANVLEKGNSSS